MRSSKWIDLIYFRRRCRILDYAVEIYKLSSKFYTDYTIAQHPELMQKDTLCRNYNNKNFS